VLSCTARRAGVLTWLYFSPGGNAYCLRRGARLSSSSHLYLTANAPWEKEGAYILLLTEAPLEAEALLNWMERPNRPDPGSGLLARRVFGTPVERLLRPGWLDVLRPEAQPPLGFGVQALELWPSSLARLDEAGRPVLKDCSIASTARTAFLYDSYGPYSAWDLDWGDEISLHFGFPEGGLPRRAELLLYGAPRQEDNADYPAGPEGLQVEINGWNASGLGLGLAPDSGGRPQPIRLSVAQYLREGRNSARLSIALPASQVWHLERIELWAQ
jgi:hypothetical protein